MPVIGSATQWSSLFSKQQPGGFFIVQDINEHPGNLWFVDSGSGTDGAGYGRSPAAPFATLDYAVGQCTASNGDTILCMPGHAEVVAAAAGLVFDVVGITVRGLGEGASMPTITLTDPASDIDIDAADVVIEHMEFVAGAADITAAIDVNACRFTVRDCRFVGDNAGLNAVIWIQDAAAGASDRITVEDCYINDVDASNTHFINFSGTGTGHIIRRNTFQGDWGTMCIGGAGIVTRVVVTDNLIFNAGNTVDSCVNLAATTTGIVARNLCAGAAAVANGITATGCLKAENYYQVLAADLSGLLDPPNV
jgi:hypothetical protein